MDNSNKKQQVNIARWIVRSLAIASSTLSLVDFLKGDFQSACILALGWLAIVTAEKRMFKNPSPDSKSIS